MRGSVESDKYLERARGARDGTQASGTLLLESSRGVGRLFLRRGRVIRAATEAPALSGAAAVYEMVSWTEGEFDFLAGDVGGVDEIQASTTYLLMEGARRIDEAQATRAQRTTGPHENKL